MNLGSMKGTVLQSLLLYHWLHGRIFAADIPRGAVQHCGELTVNYD